MVGSLGQNHFGLVNHKHPHQSANNSSETSPTSGSFPHGPIKYNTANSVATASEHVPRSGATNPVKTMLKPASKTSLGSVTVKFYPPGFQTFKVTVTAGGEPIESQKLRRMAIESFVKQTFPEVGTSFAINTQAERKLSEDGQTTESIHDHIIFPFRNTAQKKWIKSRIGNKSGVVKDVTKKPKRKTGGEEELILCKISKGALSDQDFNNLEKKDLKRRNLDILLRTFARRDGAESAQTLQELPSVLESKHKQIDVMMTNRQSESEPRSSRNYAIKLRSRMFLDFAQSTIRFDYDLVPVISFVVTLTDLIKDVIGGELVSKNGALVLPGLAEGREEVDYLPMIKHMLCGLKAHCAYLPNNKSQARWLSEESYHQGRCFQIKDVKFPDQGTEFTTDEGVRYTVQQYFDEVILPDRRLQHPDWPVVQDDAKAWIPLEKLYVAPHQVLSRCGYLRERLISTARMYMKNHGEHRLREHAKGILRELAATRVGEKKSVAAESGEGSSATSWMDDNTLSFHFAQNPDLFPGRKAVTSPKKRSNIALLRIAHGEDEDLDSSFFGNLKFDLDRKYQSNRYDCTEDDILIKGRSIKDIVGDVHQHELILAVTSVALDRKGSPRQTFACLRSLCEREHGIMLVCQKGTRFVKPYADYKGSETCFPLDIQRRIDFMLGKPNFKSNVLSTIPADLRDRFMIMGAHITHKSLHEKKTTKYIPSVAAVVASTNGTALTFPGSSRFQRTTAEITDSGRVPEHSIPDLQRMLSERFWAWADQNTPPAYILFYRDSVEFDNNVASEECRAIRNAFVDHFGQVYLGQMQMPMLTYIVVNKNAELQYLPHGPDAPSTRLNQDFVIEQGKAKHRYYVVCNDSNLSREHLQELTRDLNNSNQLYPQLDQVAKALPLTWAANLCERVNGYVASAKPGDLALPEIKRLKKPTEQEIKDEDEAIVDVKKYLEIDDSKPRRLPWKKELDYKMFYL